MAGLRIEHGFSFAAVLALTACAGQPRAIDGGPDTTATSASPAEPDATATAVTSPLPPDLECKAPVLPAEEQELLDKTQIRIEQIVYGTSRWFDGLFGVSQSECAGAVSRGSVGGGIRWDERSGTRFRGRLRARVALPALDRRARLVVGRGDADRIIDGTDDEILQAIPERFEEFNDQDFLLGVGYSRGAGLRRGWDLGAGIKLSTPVDPYARIRYHWNPIVAERWLWRITPQLFWQDSRGSGVSLTNTVDFAAAERWMLRSWTSVVEDDVSQGVEWATRLTAYQNLSRRSAFAYSLFANGESEYEVPLLDYGVEIRYRRSILREWFFVEILSSVSWPREFEIEQRETNLGVGLEFEMQFGEWAGRDSVH